MLAHWTGLVHAIPGWKLCRENRGNPAKRASPAHVINPLVYLVCFCSFSQFFMACSKRLLPIPLGAGSNSKHSGSVELGPSGWKKHYYRAKQNSWNITGNKVRKIFYKGNIIINPWSQTPMEWWLTSYYCTSSNKGGTIILISEMAGRGLAKFSVFELDCSWPALTWFFNLAWNFFY